MIETVKTDDLTGLVNLTVDAKLNPLTDSQLEALE